MKNVVIPAAAYALWVFAAGFVIGTARVLLLVPSLGEVAAVLAELPVMIAISWIVAAWAVGRWQVPETLLLRVKMGTLAFAILMVCEAVVSVALFGNAPAEHFAHYLHPQSWPGLAGQMVFAAMPALLLLRAGLP